MLAIRNAYLRRKDGIEAVMMILAFAGVIGLASYLGVCC